MTGVCLTIDLSVIVGRIYAGVLGLLALVVVLIRGLRYGGGAESTMITATLVLLGFASLGLVVGTLAQWIVDDSVRSVVEAELAVGSNADQQGKPPAAAVPSGGTQGRL